VLGELTTGKEECDIVGSGVYIAFQGGLIMVLIDKLAGRISSLYICISIEGWAQQSAWPVQ